MIQTIEAIVERLVTSVPPPASSSTATACALPSLKTAQKSKSASAPPMAATATSSCERQPRMALCGVAQATFNPVSGSISYRQRPVDRHVRPGHGRAAFCTG